MYPQFNRYFAPPDTGSGPAEETETFELLNEEEPEEETLELPKTGKKDEDADAPSDGEEDKEKEEPEEEDELKEIEKELEEKPDTEEELEAPVLVSRKEILKKYPNLYKDFPQLEKAYYRERQFSEILPTVQDAKIAVEKSRILDNVEREVMSGNIGSVLQAAKEESQEAFLKIADNYLPTLRNIDQQAYYHVLGNVIKDTILTMVKEGKALGEQGTPLQAAANVLNQFVFGSQNFTPSAPLSKQSDPQIAQQTEQRMRWHQQQIMGTFETVKDDLQTRADNVLKSTIDKHIDPRGSMTDYVKTHAVTEAHQTLETLLSKDTRFRTIIDKLWERAFERGFDKESTDKIKSAYLSKAKTLLPSVIKRARNDALKGMGKRTSDEVEEETKPVSSGAPSSGRSTSQPSGRIRRPSDIPKGMSTLDVLMKD